MTGISASNDRSISRTPVVAAATTATAGAVGAGTAATVASALGHPTGRVAGLVDGVAAVTALTSYATFGPRSGLVIKGGEVVPSGGLLEKGSSLPVIAAVVATVAGAAALRPGIGALPVGIAGLAGLAIGSAAGQRAVSFQNVEAWNQL